MSQLDPELIARFAALFQGSTRSHGKWDPSAPKAKQSVTIKNPPADLQYQQHCEGKMGLGVVPINDDAVCVFGAIDIDTHGPNAFETTPEAVAAGVAKLNLPLIACRSKSGGTHCYAFYSKPTGAGFVRAQLSSWAAMLGFTTAEIFPKQEKLHTGALGNWINLPYFDGDSGNRYAVIGGKRSSFEYFLDSAESTKADDAKVDVNSSVFDFTNGPPCVERIYTERRGEGHRNLSLFQASIWLKRQYPDDWKLKAEVFNNSAFSKPLDSAEFKKIIGSVAKRDYAYKCKDEPCISLCNKDLCKKLKFGVLLGSDYANLPPVESIVKADTDPPSWHLRIHQTNITMKTDDLMYYANFRKRVMERTNKLLDPMKTEDWESFLADMLSTRLVVRSDSDGVGINDSFMYALQSITRDAQTERQEPSEKRRRIYVRETGPAVVNGPEGKPVVMLRLNHLDSRLRAGYGIQMATSQIVGLLMNEANAEPQRVELGGKRVNVWVLAPIEVTQDDHTVFKADY